MEAETGRHEMNTVKEQNKYENYANMTYCKV